MESVEEMARRDDLIGATLRPAGVQGDTSGSVELRGAASRSAALLMSALSTALPTARLLNRRTARTSAEALLLHVSRGHSSAKRECAKGKVTGDGSAELHGRLTRLWSRPATSAAPRMMKTVMQARVRGAKRADLSRGSGECEDVARFSRSKQAQGVRGWITYRLVEMRRGVAGWAAGAHGVMLASKQSPSSSRR